MMTQIKLTAAGVDYYGARLQETLPKLVDIIKQDPGLQDPMVYLDQLELHLFFGVGSEGEEVHDSLHAAGIADSSGCAVLRVYACIPIAAESQKGPLAYLGRETVVHLRNYLETYQADDRISGSFSHTGCEYAHTFNGLSLSTLENHWLVIALGFNLSPTPDMYSVK